MELALKERLSAIKRLSGEAQSVAFGTIFIVAFTLISKGLGFIREMVLAAQFGTSWRLDAVIIAMDPAESLSGIIAGALGTMMIPLYLEVKNGKDPQQTARYASQVLKLAAVTMLCFSALLFFFPDILIKVFAPSYTGEILEYAARKLRILSVMPFIHSLGSIFTAVLRAERRFIQMASFQLIFNIVAIPVLFFLAPFWAEASYVFAWVVGYFVMTLLMGLYSLRFFDKKELFKVGRVTSSAKQTLRLAIPLVIGSSSGMINNIVDKIFASFLPVGRISALRYSHVLLAMINAIIVGSFMTTTYTEIGEAAVRKDFQAIERRMKKTNDDLMRIVIPLTFWVILMAEPLIRIIFQRGAFDTASTELVSISLIGYSMIIILSPIGGLISNTLVSLKDIKFINWLAFVTIALNAFFDWILLKPFGHAGIAFSTTAVSIVCVLFYYWWLKTRYSISFFDLKKFVIFCAVNLILFLLLLVLESVIHEVLFLLIGNISFLSLFAFLNRKIIRQVILRFKMKTAL
jgi:putative peptidoglycan lipid II flippase